MLLLPFRNDGVELVLLYGLTNHLVQRSQRGFRLVCANRIDSERGIIGVGPRVKLNLASADAKTSPGMKLHRVNSGRRQ